MTRRFTSKRQIFLISHQKCLRMQLQLGVACCRAMGQLHAPATLLLGKPLHTYCIGSYVTLKTGLGFTEKRKMSCPYQELNSDSVLKHPAFLALSVRKAE